MFEQKKPPLDIYSEKKRHFSWLFLLIASFFFGTKRRFGRVFEPPVRAAKTPSIRFTRTWLACHVLPVDDLVETMPRAFWRDFHPVAFGSWVWALGVGPPPCSFFMKGKKTPSRTELLWAGDTPKFWFIDVWYLFFASLFLNISKCLVGCFSWRWVFIVVILIILTVFWTLKIPKQIWGRIVLISKVVPLKPMETVSCYFPPIRKDLRA